MPSSVAVGLVVGTWARQRQEQAESRRAQQALYAAQQTAPADVVVGADVVEVSPPYDGPGEITSILANRVVLEILNGMAERKTDTH